MTGKYSVTRKLPSSPPLLGHKLSIWNWYKALPRTSPHQIVLCFVPFYLSEEIKTFATKTTVMIMHELEKMKKVVAKKEVMKLSFCWLCRVNLQSFLSFIVSSYRKLRRIKSTEFKAVLVPTKIITAISAIKNVSNMRQIKFYEAWKI